MCTVVYKWRIFSCDINWIQIPPPQRKFTHWQKVETEAIRQRKIPKLSMSGTLCVSAGRCWGGNVFCVGVGVELVSSVSTSVYYKDDMSCTALWFSLLPPPTHGSSPHPGLWLTHNLGLAPLPPSPAVKAERKWIEFISSSSGSLNFRTYRSNLSLYRVHLFSRDLQRK